MTFTALVDWGGTMAEAGTLEWNFGDGSPTVVNPGNEVSETHAYLTTGARTVTMRAVNVDGEDLAVQQLTVPNALPIAGFSFRPAAPSTGDDVQFASSSADPGGSIVSHSWNFGDGTSSPVPNPTHPYSTAGPKTVTLTVTDSNGATAATSQQVVVQSPPVAANAAPKAGFALSPRHPRVGQQVEFVSGATDPEGGLRAQRWDLDGDGQFDDGQGDRVLETYTTAGDKTIRLRVEDAAGAAAIAERVLTVAPGPTARAGFLNPFPVVRINGEAYAFGTRVRVLSVRAPRNTLVRVKCTGTGCPAKQRRRRVGKSRVVRFRAFERTLRAGVRLQVFARKADKIGKYTSFRIRANQAPKRVDRCLVPGKGRPVRCGSRETRVPVTSP